MADGMKIVGVDAVPEEGSYLFMAEDAFTNEKEIILVHCNEKPGVRAWVNTCPHESQQFDTGNGAPMRDDEIICPRHGSLFDACTGRCGNGPAAGTTLPDVEITVEEEDVF
jgi:nitrite reductase/ring-hydroxylating ferredoxin subunit